MLAWDGGTSTVLSRRKGGCPARRGTQQPTGRFPIGPLLRVRRPGRSEPVCPGVGLGRGRSAGPHWSHVTFRSPKWEFYFVEISSCGRAVADRPHGEEGGVLTGPDPE
ncbi:hypothetical protein GCM10010433_63800 [Streptomyces pulveraceus]